MFFKVYKSYFSSILFREQTLKQFYFCQIAQIPDETHLTLTNYCLHGHFQMVLFHVNSKA